MPYNRNWINRSFEMGRQLRQGFKPLGDWASALDSQSEQQNHGTPYGVLCRGLTF